ncbi:hypothetical protein [Curtobacterium flaccumfaciens]|uniref:hypothetical protein n=1 Tax=Curtobacterium flaccumfaciens TaxID=2035 RepID=UPI00112AE72A|nr:hypothetical protein [Curtobacterium flaccumfaciens]
MSLDLAAEREWVRDILTGLDLAEAYSYLPGRTSLPAFLILPDSPYITSGGGFGQARLHLRVAYVSRDSANNVETGNVDAAMSAAIGAFIPKAISIDGASAPYSLTINNQPYLAADLQISYTVTL